MPYITLSGIRTYHEVIGDGEPLLLLHGGFCSIETLRPQIDALSQRFRVYSPERPGQGRTADREGPITFDLMVSDTLAYLDAMQVTCANIIGFSDGAIVGMLLARDHPSRVRSLVAIGANLNPAGLTDDPSADIGKPSEHRAPSDASALDTVIRADYDRLSPDGAAHAEVVLEKLARLWREEPQIDPAGLTAITAPSLIMAGDHDSIRIEHTVEIAKAVRGAQLCVVPGASHMVMMERPGLVNEIIREFLDARLAIR
jgi:pimeloyl-ACP methyl ester carboxylesterase